MKREPYGIPFDPEDPTAPFSWQGQTFDDGLPGLWNAYARAYAGGTFLSPVNAVVLRSEDALLVRGS